MRPVLCTAAVVLTGLVLYGGLAPRVFAAESGRRVALVIGNASYQSGGYLSNTRNDAADVADALGRQGLAVQRIADGSRRQTISEIGGLAATGPPTDLIFFYYAGHGISIDGRNFIVPVDTDVGATTNIEEELIAVDWIVEQLRRKARRVVILLDSCRNNPFIDRVNVAGNQRAARGLAVQAVAPRPDPRGLSQMTSGDVNLLVAFATQPNNVAADGDPGDRNSPFTKGLLRHIGDKVEIREMLGRVRSSVVADTKGAQIPWDQSSLTEPIYLAGPPPVRPGANIRSIPPP